MRLDEVNKLRPEFSSSATPAAGPKAQLRGLGKLTCIVYFVS